jgi:hypothetical protein
MKGMKTITSPGDTQRLSNGLPMPVIGYGTYLAPDDTAGRQKHSGRAGSGLPPH